MTKPPFAYYGGKIQLAPWILEQFPPHQVYCEVFGGSGAVLLAKRPAPLEVYNDRDTGLAHFYRVLRDPDLYPEFTRRVSAWPYHRGEYHWARETWDTCADPVERAVRWFVVAKQSFSGAFGRSWSFATSPGSGKGTQWMHSVEALATVHQRLQSVQVECQDWAAIVDTYDGSDTLFYCDPPYVTDTRSERRVYSHEMSLEDHGAFVDRIRRIRGMAVISGYQHPVYDALETAGWTRLDRGVFAHATAKTRLTQRRGSGAMQDAGGHRIESLWINPAARQRRRQMTLWEAPHDDTL